MTTSISVQLDDETAGRLELLAAQTGRSKADHLREIIERGMDDAEDYYYAASVLERVRKSQEATHSSADVRASLDLDRGVN